MDHTYFANSTNLPKINSKSNKKCNVPQCGNRTCRVRKISLHRFPTDSHVLMNWMYLFKLEKKPKYAYACSDHFCSDDFNSSKTKRRLKPEAIPSRKLPIYSAEAVKKQTQKENRQKWNLRKQLFYQKILARSEEKSVIPEIVVPKEKTACPIIQKHPPIAKKQDVSVQVDSILPTFPTANRPKIMDLIRSDAHMQTCTNLTIKQFHTICELVNSFLNRIPGIGSEELGISTNILLTLMKLKENHSFSHLSFLFDMNAASCSSSFYKMIKILRQVLHRFITWPSKEEIRRNLPKQFSNWPQTRVLIDYVEIEVRGSRCLKCNNSLCSHSKIKPTIKLLVGMAPSGPVIFLTDVYDGETPAKTILDECGLLNLCEPGDLIISNSVFVTDKPCEATAKPASQSEQSRSRNEESEEIKSVLPRTRPVAVNTKLLPENIKPTPGNTKPAAENTRPVPGNTRPAPGNTRPASGNTKLTVGNTRPAAENTKPATENTRPAPGNTKLAPGNAKPAPGNTRRPLGPVPENIRPAPGNTKPLPQNTRPVGANTKPVVTSTRPVVTSSRPTITNIRPTAGTISPSKVHIKTVERIKSYEIINSPITSEMFDNIDTIINVICALVNFVTASED